MHGVAVAIVALLWLVLSAVVSAQPTDPQERAELRTFLEQAINNAESFEDRYDAEVWLVDMSSRLARFVDDPRGAAGTAAPDSCSRGARRITT